MWKTPTHFCVRDAGTHTGNKKREEMHSLNFLQTVLAEECCGIEVGGKVRI